VRVVLIGSAADRARLRTVLAHAAIEVVGEAPTIAAARAAGYSADAFLVVPTPNVDRGPVVHVEEEPLTRRELEVLELLALGLPNKAIAARLDISDQTVKSHVASICGKFGAVNRTDAVRLAVRQGLITL
jgi:DNA-binding CsgD family transcriptional regulator